jgi:hypothetical protein
MPDADRSPLESLGGLKPEMEMDDPMIHSELLYCTIERNQKCDNEGQRRYITLLYGMPEYNKCVSWPKPEQGDRTNVPE